MDLLKSVSLDLWNYFSFNRQLNKTTITASPSVDHACSRPSTKSRQPEPPQTPPKSRKSSLAKSKKRPQPTSSDYSSSNESPHAKRQKTFSSNSSRSVADEISSERSVTFNASSSIESAWSSPERTTPEWGNALDEHEESLVIADSQDYTPPNAAALEREYSRREKEAATLVTAGWSSPDVFLFRKLAMRGFEPLMPWEWFEKDLSALPTALFTKDDNEAFIKGLNMDGYTTCFRAIRHLNMLIELGHRARAKQRNKRDPGRWIKHEIEAYVKWTLKDAAITNAIGFPPILAISVGGARTAGHVLQAQMTRRLQKLSENWHRIKKGLRSKEDLELSSLYGIIITHTVMAFVAYNLEGVNKTDPAAELRIIGLFDFSDRGYDVWNALAIAIFTIHCRNRLLELITTAPSLSAKFEKAESPDPDA